MTEFSEVHRYVIAGNRRSVYFATMHRYARPFGRGAIRLFVISCLLIMCVGQVLAPAARIMRDAESPSPAGAATLLAVNTIRGAQPPCGSDIRNCFTIKLAPVFMTAIQAPLRHSGLALGAAQDSTWPTGLPPGVPTPPPRPI